MLKRKLELCLALLQRILPGAKVVFLKTFTAHESPAIRASAICSLGKLVEADNLKRNFVKETLEMTPDTKLAKTYDEAPKVKKGETSWAGVGPHSSPPF